MNHLRSTEKSLKLLRLKRSSKLAVDHSKTTISHRSFTFESIQRASQRTNRKNLLFQCLKGPKIKYVDITKVPKKRALSTSAIIQLNKTNSLKDKVQQKSFFNPDKADPHEAGEETLLPIPKPLTSPRFQRVKGGNEVPAVTRVLQATMPASSLFILERWRESMIRKLGQEGFAMYQKDTFERGRALHALIADHLMRPSGNQTIQTEVECSTEIVKNLWKSIEKVVRNRISNVRLIEHTISYPEMNYRGIIDCVARFDNELAVIDFKTAEKFKKNADSLYDNPIQVAAYCGALNNDSSIAKNIVDTNVCSGVIVVAYVDGTEASTYVIDKEKLINDYWKQWTTRLEQYMQLEAMKKIAQ